MKLATGAERVTALTMLVICVGLVIAGHQLQYWDGFAPAAGFAPVWVGIVGVVLCGLMLFQIGGSQRTDENLPDRPALLRVLMTIVALWIFIAITPLVGMILAGLAFMVFLLLAILRRPLFPSIATAVGTAALVYVIFITWLGVPLPHGLLHI